MSSRRRTPQLPPQRPRPLDVAHVADVSSTTESPKPGFASTANFEKLEPPFRGGDEHQGPVSWRDVSLTVKIIGGAVTLMVTVVGPAVWFASKMDTSVDRLRDDVKEIKTITTGVAKESTTLAQRMLDLERSMSDLRATVFGQARSTDSQAAPPPGPAGRQAKP